MARGRPPAMPPAITAAGEAKTRKHINTNALAGLLEGQNDQPQSFLNYF